MERKTFLRNSLGLFSTAAILSACKKDDTSATGSGTATGSGSCIVMPEEVEGPYPYPGGELTNPLNRSDIVGGQSGVPLTLDFTVVNANASCAAVSGARVDIWHCNNLGYYSGYANQPGISGTQSYTGQTWLRGYQLADSNGKLQFVTIYPGWYSGRATHIHLEVFVNNVLKKTSQITFSETISDTVHTSSLYAAHGTNTTRNASDSIFGNSSTDLANETVALTGSVAAGYSGSYSIGIAL
ncbi:MAG: intradiol ring-cleavage dioxygenase [Ferruginibacter sp.]